MYPWLDLCENEQGGVMALMIASVSPYGPSILKELLAAGADKEVKDDKVRGGVL